MITTYYFTYIHIIDPKVFGVAKNTKSRACILAEVDRPRLKYKALDFIFLAAPKTCGVYANVFPGPFRYVD